MKKKAVSLTVKALVFAIAITIPFLMTSCSNKKKVPIYKNEVPTSKKPMPGEAPTEVPVPTADGMPIGVVFDEETLTIENTHKDVVLEYKDIESYTYMQQLDYEYDDLKEGNNTPSMICGLMQEENDEESEYYLYIYKATKTYLSIEYRGKLYIFNLESDDATSACYETMKEKMIKSTEKK